MDRDEFNYVNICNDRQVSGNEFGNFQRDEFVVKANNVNTAGQDELNATNPSELNDLGTDHAKEGNDIDKAYSQRDRDLIEDAANGNSGSSAASSGGSSSSSASSSSASSTAGSSGVSASSSAVGGVSASAGAAAATGSVAASTIVVASALVATIAAPIVLSNAKANWIKPLEVVENAVSYEVELVETVEDEKYVARLTNAHYDESQDLKPGVNQGSFTNLGYGETYQFIVEEGDTTEIKRILLQDVFTTAEYVEPEPTLVSEFRGHTFEKFADYKNYTTEITLNYIDEKEIFSDFVFTLTAVDASVGFTHDYPLLATTETQLIKLRGDENDDIAFDLDLAYTYKISYKEDGVPVVIDGGDSFTFIDDGRNISEFYGFTVSPDANFVDDEITVTLNYRDDYECLDQFVLNISESQSGGLSPQGLIKRADGDQIITEDQNGNIQVTLKTTTEPQIVKVPGLDFRNKSYVFSVSYYHGKKATSESSETSDPVTFNDISNGVSEIYGATVDTDANFVTNTLYVTLNYRDDYKFYSDFLLTLMDAEMPEELIYYFPLDKTTDKQPATCSEEEAEINFYSGSFNYQITCNDSRLSDGTTVVATGGPMTFTDVSNGVTEFFGATVDEGANFLTNTIYVTLNYQDDFRYYYDFNLELIDKTTSDPVSYFFPLDRTTSKQPSTCIEQDAEINFLNGVFDYSITVCDRRDEEPISTIVTQGTGISFTDISGGVSTFNSATINTEANFLTGTVYVTLNYQDDFHYYSEFALILTQANISDGLSYYFPLDNTTDPQPATCEEEENGTFLFNGPFNYRIVGNDRRVVDTAENVLYEGGPIDFSDNSGGLSQVTSATLSPQADFINKTITVDLSFQDDFGFFYGFEALLIYEDEIYYTFPLDPITGPQTASQGQVSDDDLIEFDQCEFSYQITYLDSRDEEPIPHVITSGSEFSFTNSYVGESTFTSFSFVGADYEQQTLDVQLQYSDPNNDEFGDFELFLYDNDAGDNGVNIELILDKTTEVQTINLLEYALDMPFDLEHDNCTYILYYFQNGATHDLRGTINVADYQGRTSGISKCAFELDENDHPYAHSVNGTFGFTFEYYDYFGTLMWSDFTLRFTKEVEGDGVSSSSQTLTQSYSINVNSQMAPHYTFDYKNGGSEYSYNGDYIDLLDGEPVQYQITYYDPDDPNEEPVVFDYGTVTFSDITTPHIDNVELGLLVPRGDEEETDYYLPFRMTYYDIANRYDTHLTARFENSSGQETKTISLLFMQTDGMVGNNDNWQCGWLPIDNPDDVSYFIDNEDVEIVIIWSHEDENTGEYVEEVAYRAPVTLSVQDDSTPLNVLGMVMEDGAMYSYYDEEIGDVYALSINYLFYNGTIEQDVNKVTLVFKQDGETVFSIELDDVPESCQDIGVGLGSYSSYLNASYDVYISYYDSNMVYQEVLCYQNLYIYPQV